MRSFMSFAGLCLAAVSMTSSAGAQEPAPAPGAPVLPPTSTAPAGTSRPVLCSTKPFSAQQRKIITVLQVSPAIGCARARKDALRYHKNMDPAQPNKMITVEPDNGCRRVGAPDGPKLKISCTIGERVVQDGRVLFVPVGTLSFRYNLDFRR